MKILVTGATGQLGNELMRQSIGSVHTFIFTDVQEMDVCMFGERFIVKRMDITDPLQVAEFVSDDVDVIINCAAFTDVNAAESRREVAELVNVQGPACLARAAKDADALLIHISTDYVFDGNSNVPYTEECETSPLNFYGETKVRSEQEIISSGCKYMIFRTSWMYSSHGRNFFITMDGLTADRPEIKVVCDQVGTPTSAYDLAFFINHIIEHDMLDRTGIYNYSNEGTCSWYDFAADINYLLGHTCRVVSCTSSDYPTPARRPAYSVLDKTKVKKTFGVEIPNWRDSLRLVVKEYMHRYE